MIGIVDFGSGNIQAIKNVFSRLNIPSEYVRTADDFNSVDKLILPGVGAFDQVMEKLEGSGLRDPLDKCVLQDNIPILGVCVGMQIMAHKSEEGSNYGLGWISGAVKRFDEKLISHKPKIPHMGWNSITPVKSHLLFKQIDVEKGFYFLHSYYFCCDDESQVFSWTDYGQRFASAVNRKNIYGFQFHPEKSHSNGVNLFKNFAEL